MLGINGNKMIKTYTVHCLKGSFVQCSYIFYLIAKECAAIREQLLNVKYALFLCVKCFAQPSNKCDNAYIHAESLREQTAVHKPLYILHLDLRLKGATVSQWKP